MKVDFCKGLIRTTLGQKVSASWAETPFGILALVDDLKDDLQVIQAEQILVSDTISSLDLPGLERDGVQAIVSNILMRGYLDKPGIRDKGEAVLFILVNEAIHDLSAVCEEESKNESLNQ
jgi:hypothetical protein